MVEYQKYTDVRHTYFIIQKIVRQLRIVDDYMQVGMVKHLINFMVILMQMNKMDVYFDFIIFMIIFIFVGMVVVKQFQNYLIIFYVMVVHYYVQCWYDYYYLFANFYCYYQYLVNQDL